MLPLTADLGRCLLSTAPHGLLRSTVRVGGRQTRPPQRAELTATDKCRLRAQLSHWCCAVSTVAARGTCAPDGGRTRAAEERRGGRPRPRCRRRRRGRPDSARQEHTRRPRRGGCAWDASSPQRPAGAQAQPTARLSPRRAGTLLCPAPAGRRRSGRPSQRRPRCEAGGRSPSRRRRPNRTAVRRGRAARR